MRPSKLSIGDFNDVISVIPITEGSRNSYGSPTRSEGTAMNIWANVKEKTTEFVDEHGAVKFPIHYEIKVRKGVSGVSEGNKVVFSGKSLTIISVVDYDKSTVTLKCKGV